MKLKPTPRRSANPILLTPSQLETRRSQLLVVDVRSWVEYLMGHIPGAQCFSRHRILKEIPKHQPIALTCLSGQRSSVAAQWLVSQGYHQVYNLQGGLMAWEHIGYPVQRGPRP